MFETKRLKEIDWKMIPILLLLALISLIVISSYSQNQLDSSSFFTPMVKQQIVWYIVGFALFFGVALFDYRKLRDWSLPLYVLTLFLLLVFFLSTLYNTSTGGTVSPFWDRVFNLLNMQNLPLLSSLLGF